MEYGFLLLVVFPAILASLVVMWAWIMISVDFIMDYLRGYKPWDWFAFIFLFMVWYFLIAIGFVIDHSLTNHAHQGDWVTCGWFV